MRAVTLLSAILLSSGALQGQAKLQITSPRDGTVVHPGDTVTVLVSASGAIFQAVILIGPSPIGFVDPVAAGPPYRFSIPIPPGTQPGPYSLTADGAVRAGEGVSSHTIVIDVEPPDVPVRLTTDFDSLELDVDDRIGLGVTGEYADGSKLDLTQSTQVAFVPEIADIVSVSDYGLVTALRPGSTAIVINGVLKIPVTVRPPVRIYPGEATLHASQTYEFSARVAPSLKQALTWSLSPEGVGSVNAEGFYTAPVSVPVQQTVTLTAHAAGGDATSTITLSPESWVRISPGWAVRYPSQPLQFAAETANVGNAGVIWSIHPVGAGVINASGLYTAPAVISALQKVIVTATSAMNPSVSQSIDMWISPQPFVLFAWDNYVYVSLGSSVTAKILELASDGFPHPVVFSASGLPGGISASFSPTALTGTGDTLLTISASPAALPGKYKFTVTGTDTVYARLTSSQAVTFTVQASP